MLRRLHPEQPTPTSPPSPSRPANQAWAQAQITKYPEGRQASAIIPLLWRAQEQEGWLSRPAIEHVADMLGMAYIRALEVATFYFMFQLQPVGVRCAYPDLRHHVLHDLRGRGSGRGLQGADRAHPRIRCRRMASSRWEEVECWAPAPMRRWPRSARITTRT
jgi:hypothetical protein